LPEPDPRARPQLILVVEDDADLRVILAETLATAGYHVATAVDGEDGLRRMRAQHPDAVVLDLMMPRMDGWQFRLEQKRDAALRGTPVIAMSADHSAAAATIDADLYLQKPFAPAEILSAVDTVLLARRRAQEVIDNAQTERLIALGTLAAGVAHEINNPLTYVLLNLAAASRHLATVVCEPHRDTLDRIACLLRDATDGSERIRTIVRGIRLFSRPDERPTGAVDVRLCLDGAVRLVMDDLRMRARLVTTYDTVPLVRADDSRLGQVFLNLVTNAIQAIPEGAAGDHEIRVTTRTDERGRAVVEIADSGCGIPAHLRSRIFEPFFTTKAIGEGTGLGLSISHGVVRALGGEITVDSEVGRGSTFRVTLPAIDGVPHPVVEAAAPPRRRRILVVDDEPAVCAGVASALGEQHDVVEAGSAREALDRITANPTYDVLLCDLQMPGMSGLELVRCVRTVWPAMRTTVIFMTAGPVPAEVDALVSAREAAVLPKPLAIDRVRALVS
jgi:signal transduction histidine kinase